MVASRPIVPRQAVILAAGVGSRLRPLTDTRPKPLVEVCGVPILYNALQHLAAIGITSATIVVGYRKELIQKACGLRFQGVEITYAESASFDRTGSAYSLWLARETLLRGSTILLEGDVFFELEILKRLVSEGEQEDAAAVAPFSALMEGSAVTLTCDGLINDVRMKQSAESLQSGLTLFKTINLFRFSAPTLRNVLVPALDQLIESGATSAYTEQLLADLVGARGLRMKAARCDDLKWYEVDSEADLRIAEAIFRNANGLDNPTTIASLLPTRGLFPAGESQSRDGPVT
jgi:NDP-sugar pyrophosphorylase family protein